MRLILKKEGDVVVLYDDTLAYVRARNVEEIRRVVKRDRSVQARSVARLKREYEEAKYDLQEFEEAIENLDWEVD